jgi:hypothetical protein
MYNKLKSLVKFALKNDSDFAGADKDTEIDMDDVEGRSTWRAYERKLYGICCSEIRSGRTREGGGRGVKRSNYEMG